MLSVCTQVRYAIFNLQDDAVVDGISRKTVTADHAAPPPQK